MIICQEVADDDDDNNDEDKGEMVKSCLPKQNIQVSVNIII